MGARATNWAKAYKKTEKVQAKNFQKIATFTPVAKNLWYNNNVIKKGRLKVARGEKIMKSYSKNKKLNGLLNDIRDEILELGIEEILQYHDEFKGQASDFNIVEYGNLLIYYDDIRELYEKNGYKSIKNWSDDRIWDTYKRQVGYIVRDIVGDYKRAERLAREVA